VRIWLTVDACGNPATCNQAIGLGAPEPPEIDCPDGPIDISLCEPGTVCIDLAARHYDSVTVDGKRTNFASRLLRVEITRLRYERTTVISRSPVTSW
jgi:hypothetical protein